MPRIGSMLLSRAVFRIVIACAALPCLAACAGLSLPFAPKPPKPDATPAEAAAAAVTYSISSTDVNSHIQLVVRNDGKEPLTVRPEDIAMILPSDRRNPVYYDAQSVVMDPLGFTVPPGQAIPCSLIYNGHRGRCAGNFLVFNPGGDRAGRNAVKCRIGGAGGMAGMAMGDSLANASPTAAPRP